MTTMPEMVAAAMMAAGATLLFWGSRIALSTPARLSGALFASAGLLVGVGGLLGATHHPFEAAVVVSEQVFALALMAYPVAERDWSSVVAAGVVVLGPGLVVWSGRNATPETSAVLLAVIAMLQIWWRLETATRAHRIALLWLLVALVPVALFGAAVGFMQAPPQIVAAAILGVGGVGWAAWRGLTRPRDVDVRAIVTGLAVNGIAFLTVLTMFEMATTAAVALGASNHLGPLAAIIAASCALAFPPVRGRLRVVAEQILFGRRPDPVVAAARVAGGLGADPAAALEALIAALRLPYAELRIVGLQSAAAGEPVDHTAIVPVYVDGSRVGELTVGLRAGDSRLPSGDATVLALAAPLLAQTMHSRALATRLQEARELAAGAREEERRRLRRDIHDGLGPRLSGIALTADAARLGDAASTDAHLARIRVEAATAIREIRDVVYGLRPPALDELGLVEAIRVQALTLVSADGRPMRVDLEAPDLPSLPAAVEVAAYRIALEALTNSSKHSGADTARVTVTLTEGSLTVSVADCGSKSDFWVPGVGLSSMRERAHELGGSLTIVDGVVRAELPCIPRQGPAGSRP